MVWSCRGLVVSMLIVLDEKVRVRFPGQTSTRNTKSISLAISSQQISGKNSDGVFFSTKKCAFHLKKNAISSLFLKNVSPSKRVVCFILNNLHFPMVEGIAFYSLYISRVLVIPCKADDSCLFITLPDEIYKKQPGIVIQFWS